MVDGGYGLENLEIHENIGWKGIIGRWDIYFM